MQAYVMRTGVPRVAAPYPMTQMLSVWIFKEKSSLCRFALLWPQAVPGGSLCTVYVPHVCGHWWSDSLKPRLGQPPLPQGL